MMTPEERAELVRQRLPSWLHTTEAWARRLEEYAAKLRKEIKA